MITLREIVFERPHYLLIACVAWAAIAVWIVSLIGWMIQGEIDALFGFLGIALALVLGYFAFMPPVEALRPFVAVAVVGTVVVFPFLRRALNQRALVALDVEAMEDAYEILKQKPDNNLTRFKLAKILYQREQVEAALAVGAEALHGMPERLFTEEYRMYGRWKRQNPHVNLGRPITCIDCGHPNNPSAIFCARCNQPHLLDMARGRWVGRQFARKLIGAWVVGILALAGIPLASQLSPGIAIAVVLVIMGAAISLLWLAFKSPEGRARA